MKHWLLSSGNSAPIGRLSMGTRNDSLTCPRPQASSARGLRRWLELEGGAVLNADTHEPGRRHVRMELPRWHLLRPDGRGPTQQGQPSHQPRRTQGERRARPRRHPQRDKEAAVRRTIAKIAVRPAWPLGRPIAVASSAARLRRGQPGGIPTLSWLPSQLGQLAAPRAQSQSTCFPRCEGHVCRALTRAAWCHKPPGVGPGRPRGYTWCRGP